jgi:hypothetical protein
MRGSAAQAARRPHFPADQKPAFESQLLACLRTGALLAVDGGPASHEAGFWNAAESGIAPQLASLAAMFAPQLASLAAVFAPLLTSPPAIFAPLLTPLHAGGLRLNICNR